ncbi:MAG: class I SAM-dependent methyltransferase [candidate division KSB1 bacterium]|nr:class I SAM-dependent methyltransferase [candidate division KSB1 bacterium]MDZ7340259.1 class I SAM-dependent methyltransferase [candidate division KSB1 bacterium]
MDHFGWLAPFYNRLFAAQDFSKLYARLQLPIRGRLLDAGGGTGRVSWPLRDRVGGMVVLDFSFRMLQQVPQQSVIFPVQSSVERLPFPDHAFERILVVDAFHHFVDHPVAVAELLRVLHPDGLMVIEEPDIRHWAVKAVALMEKLLFMRSRFYAPDAISSLFTAQGAIATIEHDDHYTSWIIVTK